MSFCTKCGAQIEEGKEFCMNCENGVVEAVRDENYNNALINDFCENANSAMVTAILAAVFCGIPILGIILSCIGKKKVKNLIDTDKYQFTEEEKERLKGGKGKRTAAKIISSIALPFSIFYTVFIGIYIIVVVAMIAAMMA